MKGQAWSAFARIVLALLLTAGLGCREEGLPGTYSATKFTIQQAGVTTTTDVLAAGGSISLTIGTNMSTSGSLKIPANVQGGPVTASLLGSAGRVGDEVTLNLVVDSFMKNAKWTVSDGALSTVYTTSGTAFVVTLSK